MEANTKLKELEEEFKVLKAEIRNVLLDIREVILDRTNPIGEDHESAHLTLDLNTTARTMAAEAASHEAMKAVELPGEDEAVDLPGEADADAPGPPPASATGEDYQDAAEGHDDGGLPDAAGLEDAPGPPPATSAAPQDAEGESGEEPAPRVIRRHGKRQEPPFQAEEERLPTEIPPMYQATIPPLNGTVAVSRWLTDALEAVGPQELDRIITIHRLWGNLPPNISRALAYLQELLNSTEEEEPRWLKVMQELDRLASL